MKIISLKKICLQRYLLLSISLCLIAIFGFFYQNIFELIDDLEFKTIDLRFQNRGKLLISDQVVVVDLDDRTLALNPSLLEKRTQLASLILKLQDAKVIAIDLLFKSQEEILDQPLQEKITTYLNQNPSSTNHDQADLLLREVYQALLGDQQLESAFQQHKIILAYKFDQIGIDPNPKATISTPIAPFLHKGRFATTAIKQASDRKHLKIVDQPLLSINNFQKAAKAIGFVNVSLDSDGVLRSATPIYQYQNQEYSAFAIQAVLLYKGLNKSHLHYDLNENRLMMKKETWQFPNQEWLINYRGPAKTIPTFSAVDVLNGTLPKTLWQDRIVVLSKSFLFKDRIHTPLDPLMPGGEIQATLMDQLIKGDSLRKLSASEELAICLLFIFISAIDLIYLRRLNGLILILVLWLSYLTFCMIAFQHGLILPMVKPSLSLILIWGVGISYRLITELEIKAKIKESFGKYISKDVLDVLLKDDRFEIKNEVAEITILFSDIRSFTKYSENRSAQDLAMLLNQYFDPMTKAVLDHHGLVDKYIGDAIMAFFGMPVRYENHRDRALEAVIDMHRALIQLQADFHQVNWDLKIGIGLNTGEALVGNLGSSERFNYTAIGDSVNLASRIESLSSTYQLFCIVGEQTRNKASDRFLFREIDLVKVKGKDEAIALFEFLGDSQSMIIRYQAMEIFEKGMLCFRQGKLDDSQECFERFLTLNANDRVSEIYLERIEKMKLEGGVPEGWMGVVQYQAKS